MIGQTIAHYTILEKLGEGGMGVVYKAHDTILDRTVALKFLPSHLTTSEKDKERFIREAKSAAALNHPNICNVYEIGEVDGTPYIAIEYIDGDTLKHRVETGSLSIADVLDYGIQLADGLGHAHRRQIIHRDVKSDNVLLTEEGKVKITDFGLAKLRGSVQVTKTGMVVGTTAYMSPEQARGQEVDNRTDIWALGVVFYEMLTGKPPFGGQYEQAVIYSILNEKEVLLTKLRADVPSDLERTVSKALAKNPDERYKQVDEMLADLRSVKKKYELNEKDPAPGAPGIAVLPFNNIRKDPQFDYLGFALADQIIGSLSYVQNILVRPSSAIRQYQTQLTDARTAGRELEVDYILAGNFLKEADTVRLNVELVNVKSNSILWREPIQVKYENTFALQDLVSEKVIKGLRVQFSQDERNRMRADVPKDPLAYEYYLRAVSYPVTIEGDEFAIEMLEKSISLDATYAPAFSELGFRLYQLAVSAMLGSEKYTEAEQAFRKALSLNENLLTALWYLSLHFTEIGNSEEAFKLVEQMFRVTPNSAQAHFALGYLYRYAGMLEESAQEVEQALVLDARNPRFRSAGFTYVYLGNYKKAFEVFDLDRESTLSSAWKGMSLFLQGQGEQAIEYFDRAVALEPNGYIGLRHAGIRAFLKGETDKGLASIRQLEEACPSDSDSEHWYLIGSAYALLGDKAGCYRGLRKAIEGGFFNYPDMLKDPLLDSVRNDPEFQDLLTLAKRKHEAFKLKFFRN